MKDLPSHIVLDAGISRRGSDYVLFFHGVGLKGFGVVFVLVDVVISGFGVGGQPGLLLVFFGTLDPVTRGGVPVFHFCFSTY